MVRPLIYFDVTHTLGHHAVTGVQRVTRCLAAEMVLDPRVQLVRFDRGKQRFMALSETEVALVTAVEAVPAEGAAQAVNGSYKRLVKGLRAFALFRLLASVKDWLVIQLIHRARTGWARFHSRRRDSVLDGALYLTAEIVGEADRTAALRHLEKARGVRLNFIVHDLIPLSHPQFSLVDHHDFRRYTGLLKVSSHLICVSEATRRHVASRIQSARPNLRLSVRFPGFVRVPAQPRFSGPASWPADGLPLVLCVGTIEPRKNQRALLPVLRNLWNAGLKFRFVFVGNQGRFSDAFAEEVNELNQAGSSVHWLRGAPEDLLSQLYRDAIFTVYLSLVEGYGLPVLESVASGTPCLTSRGTAMEEIATSTGGCVLVDPTNPEEMQNELKRLLSDEPYRDRLKRSISLDRMATWASYKEDLCTLLADPNA